MIQNQMPVEFNIEYDEINVLLSSAELSGPDIENLEKIRKKSKELEKQSLTSTEYQSSTLDALNKAIHLHGGPIIELGVYKGGLSCQLCYLSKQHDRDIYIIDVSSEYIEMARQQIIDQGLLHSKVHFFVGNLCTFFEEHNFQLLPPCMIVVDGDHSYFGVREDLCNILFHTPDVPVVVLHDFGLRYDNSTRRAENNVSGAILDITGDTNALIPIGFLGDGTKRDDCYFQKGYPEGVILFPSLLKPAVFSVAYSYCAAASQKFLVKKHKTEHTNLYNELQQQKEHNALLCSHLSRSRWIKTGRRIGFLKWIGKFLNT